MQESAAGIVDGQSGKASEALQSQKGQQQIGRTGKTPLKAQTEYRKSTGRKA